MAPQEQQTFMKAALTVLNEAESPMSAQEITDEALRRKLVETKGKTPERSMSAELYKAAARRPDGPLVRIYKPGEQRALRGSVKWALRDKSGHKP